MLRDLPISQRRNKSWGYIEDDQTADNRARVASVEKVMKRIQVPQTVPAGFAKFGHHRFCVHGYPNMGWRGVRRQSPAGHGCNIPGGWTNDKVHGPFQRGFGIHGMIEFEADPPGISVIAEPRALLHEVRQHAVAQVIAVF